MLTESGEPDTLDECQRCGQPQAKGISFVRAGRKIFRCDGCGRHNDMGFLEAVHRRQLESREGKERATEHRDRFYRENQEKQLRAYERAKSDPLADPTQIFSLDYTHVHL